MNTKFINYLTLAVILITGFLISLNGFPIFLKPQHEKYISYNNVRGTAVKYKGQLYTLNFDQQNELIARRDQAHPASKEIKNVVTNAEIEQIVIYRFGASDIEITPLGYDQQQDFLFSTKEWNGGRLIVDASQCKMKNLLTLTCDKQ